MWLPFFKIKEESESAGFSFYCVVTSFLEKLFLEYKLDLSSENFVHCFKSTSKSFRISYIPFSIIFFWNYYLISSFGDLDGFCVTVGWFSDSCWKDLPLWVLSYFWNAEPLFVCVCFIFGLCPGSWLCMTLTTSGVGPAVAALFHASACPSCASVVQMFFCLHPFLNVIPGHCCPLICCMSLLVLLCLLPFSRAQCQLLPGWGCLAAWGTSVLHTLFRSLVACHIFCSFPVSWFLGSITGCVGGTLSPSGGSWTHPTPSHSPSHHQCSQALPLWLASLASPALSHFVSHLSVLPRLSGKAPGLCCFSPPRFPEEPTWILPPTRGSRATMGPSAPVAPLWVLVRTGVSCAWALLLSLVAPQSFSAPRVALGSAKWVLRNRVSEIKGSVGFNPCNQIYGNQSMSKENCSYFRCTFFQGYFGAVGALLELLKIPWLLPGEGFLEPSTMGSVDFCFFKRLNFMIV